MGADAERKGQGIGGRESDGGGWGWGVGGVFLFFVFRSSVLFPRRAFTVGVTVCLD